jgi:hypothetical protein
MLVSGGLRWYDAALPNSPCHRGSGKAQMPARPPPLPGTTPITSTTTIDPETGQQVIVITAHVSQSKYGAHAPAFYDGWASHGGGAATSAQDQAWATMSPTDRAQKNGINAHMKVEGLAPLGDEYEVAGGMGHNGGPRLYTPGGRGGRATEMEDFERARLGQPPRTRWDPEALTPTGLQTLGNPGRGNGTQFNVRELVGDRLDANNLAHDIARRAGYTLRDLAVSQPKPGVVVWSWGPNLQITHRTGLGTSTTPAMDVNWNGVFTKFHIDDALPRIPGP